MPFIYPKQKKGIEKYYLRDFSEIDTVVRVSIEEAEEWDPLTGMKGLKRGKNIYLLNTNPDHPPRDKADSQKFLVLLSLTKELNLGEIEKWLDYSFSNSFPEFHFDKTKILYIDQRRMYYKTPRGGLMGSLPCTHITWYPERKDE